MDPSVPSTSLCTDSSSLVDLKAEVFRKQQEAKFNKLHSTGSLRLKTSADRSKTSNKDKIWSKQNAGLTAREQKDLAVEKEKQIQIQNALEEKAKLYDKLSKGEIKNDGRFLVNFNNVKEGKYSSDEEENVEEWKEPERSQDDSERWIEYKDSLGRTRMAMKKDIPELISRDKKLKPVTSAQNDREEPVVITYAVLEEEPEQSMLSEDMRRELLRQKWEKEEEENLKKTKVHYKDVLFDEARTHGAAFYNFSRNATERATEMENLKSLHKETENARSMRNNINTKRKTAMEIRLKKVRDRKRLKLGLPLLEDEDSETELNVDPNIEERDEPTIEESVMESLKQMRENQASEKNQKYPQKKISVREWDIGKEGVDRIDFEIKSNMSSNRELSFGQKDPKEKQLLSQAEWVKEKRMQRNNDFAPPPGIYDKTSKPKVGPDTNHHTSSNLQYGISKKSKINWNSNDNPRDGGTGLNEMAMSAGFDNGLPQWNPGIEDDNKSTKTTSTKQYCKQIDPSTKYTNSDNKCSVVFKSSSDKKESESTDANKTHISIGIKEDSSASNLSLQKRLKLHRDMMDNYGGLSTLGKTYNKKAVALKDTKSSNHFEDKNIGDDEVECVNRNKGVEIAPPPSMAYYNESLSNTKQKYQTHIRNDRTSLNNMKESLKMGTVSTKPSLASKWTEDSDTD